MSRNTSDDSAQESSRKAINNLSKKTKKIGEFLCNVALGNEGDVVYHKDGTPFMDKDGEPMIRKAPLNVRVQAAKTYKELVIDKITPDKKHDPKVKNRDKNAYADALLQVAKEVREKGKPASVQGNC